MNIKEKVQQYYSDLKRLDKYKYEIKVLKDSIDCIEEQLDDGVYNEKVKERLLQKKDVVLQKSLLMNELAEELAGIEFCIGSLDEQDRLLLEYKYGKRAQYNEIELKLNMSRSTVYRRVEKLLDQIEKEIDI